MQHLEEGIAALDIALSPEEIDRLESAYQPYPVLEVKRCAYKYSARGGSHLHCTERSAVQVSRSILQRVDPANPWTAGLESRLLIRR